VAEFLFSNYDLEGYVMALTEWCLMLINWNRKLHENQAAETLKPFHYLREDDRKTRKPTPIVGRRTVWTHSSL